MVAVDATTARAARGSLACAVHTAVRAEYASTGTMPAPMQTLPVIEIVSATRLPEAGFWKDAPLGISTGAYIHNMSVLIDYLTGGR